MPLTLANAIDSELPGHIGLCRGNVPEIAAAVNNAQERLIYAGGETGWWGGWQPVRFPITVPNPEIRLPRQFNRIINLAVCRDGIPINNQFFELLPHTHRAIPRHLRDWCGDVEGYERGTVPTMVTLTPTNQKLRVFITDPRDVGKRILIDGLDQNALPFYSTDGNYNPLGFFLVFAQPFVDTTFIVTQINSVQKDVTFGEVVLQQVDMTTGAAVNLARYGPTETLPAYRRYVISRLPGPCCPSTVTVRLGINSLCKLQYIPAVNPTDWLIIQNLAALDEECQALRYSRMDTPTATALAKSHHRDAIKQLQNQLRHEEGEQHPAVNVDTWGGADLESQSIGTLI